MGKNIETRIDELEKRTGAAKQFILKIVYNGDKTKPTEAQHEAAIAAFKAENPDWEERDYILLEWFDGQYKKAHKMAKLKRWMLSHNEEFGNSYREARESN